MNAVRVATQPTLSLPERPTWKALKFHYEAIRGYHLRQLFNEDPKRGERLNVEAVSLFLDYSKNHVTDETLKLLVQLARESGLEERRNEIGRASCRERVYVLV